MKKVTQKKQKTAIRVTDIYKSFKIPHEKTKSLKSIFINLLRKKTYTHYEAAKGISFEVKEGEFLGIIGRNGSGKSTMLKMLAGIYQPDSGKIEINGKLSPFIELGVGFNPDLSARDNVYLNGAILGLTVKEVDEKFDEIIRFAELEEFVDQKLANFSSGMQVRLAFSVAIQAHADILLIDEVLAVGDVNFQNKCLKIFDQLKKDGKTIVFVSHNMGMIKKYCDRVILINNAKIEYSGATEAATIRYDLLNREGSINQNISSPRTPRETHTLGSVLEKFQNDDFLVELNPGDGHLTKLIKETGLRVLTLPTGRGEKDTQELKKVTSLIVTDIRKGTTIASITDALKYLAKSGAEISKIYIHTPFYELHKSNLLKNKDSSNHLDLPIKDFDLIKSLYGLGFALLEYDVYGKEGTAEYSEYLFKKKIDV